MAARIVAETLIGLIRADPPSYLRAYPRFTPFLGADRPIGPGPDPSITGDRSYTRAHFRYYAGVVAPGTGPPPTARLPAGGTATPGDPPRRRTAGPAGTCSRFAPSVRC